MLARVTRDVRPGDGEALAAIWLEHARYYAALFPDDFRLPSIEGLADDLDAGARERHDDRLRLVAEVDGVVAAYLSAHVEPPIEHAEWQMVAELAETRLVIDSLGTADAYQRRGLATELVEAAEAWGRARGATVAWTDTHAASPVSVPFWEQRVGYRRREVRLTKRLV
jgi:GNAT superfamily N-acetyltransferase